MDDPIHRGRRWSAFYHEDGGLKDMLAQIKATYLERLASVDPNNTDQLQVLALAHKVTQQLDGMVLSIINGAEVAQASAEYTSRMQAIPKARRRYM